MANHEITIVNKTEAGPNFYQATCKCGEWKSIRLWSQRDTAMAEAINHLETVANLVKSQLAIAYRVSDLYRVKLNEVNAEKYAVAIHQVAATSSQQAETCDCVCAPCLACIGTY